MYSFNPYCSGRWSRTNEGDILIFPTLEVLILIVVDNGLIRCLMELSVQVVLCLNPCCSGRWSRTGVLNEKTGENYHCLNPCCSGRWSRTFFNRKEFSNLSILILVVVEDSFVLAIIGETKPIKEES